MHEISKIVLERERERELSKSEIYHKRDSWISNI